jgi:two-component system C4-dicarboxylate transport sensor histidine kinase DctB
MSLLPTSANSMRRHTRTISWRARLALVAILAMAIAVVYVTNRLLTDRFTENTRNRAELRLVLYSGNLLSELRQNAIVPQLLARDPALIQALNTGDYTQSTQRLLSFLDEIGAASLTLLDRDGRTVAATERDKLGQSHRQAPYYVEALRSRDTIFQVLEDETGQYRFFYSRRIDSQNQIAGVIVVEVDLGKYERAWAGISDAVLVTDSEGQIILATEPRWRGLSEEEALRREPVECGSRAVWPFVAGASPPLPPTPVCVTR